MAVATFFNNKLTVTLSGSVISLTWRNFIFLKLSRDRLKLFLDHVDEHGNLNKLNMSFDNKTFNIFFDNAKLVTLEVPQVMYFFRCFGFDKTTSEITKSESVSDQKILEACAAYNQMCIKTVGTPFLITKGSSYWQSAAKSVEYAEDLGISPTEYVNYLCEYASNNFRQKHLWAGQLGSEKMKSIVMQQISLSKPAKGFKGLERAAFNSRLPLDEDVELSAAKRKIHKNTHTWDDITYVRERYKKVTPQTPEFIIKAIKDLEERESKPKVDDGEWRWEDHKHEFM